jgi:hypothetical protein
MNDYEIKKQNRIERYQELAEKNKRLSDQASNRAHEMASIIPIGQPILIGHYSESRDRRYRERIHNTFGKAVELDKKADYYENKVQSAENNNTISSDDPEAATKLKEKIEAAESNQTKMRGFNKCLRNKDNAGMLALGFSQSMIDELSKPDFCGRLGFVDYQLTNNNANIRRMKERLEEIEKRSQNITNEVTIGDVRILDNVEANRLQMFFPGKPDDEVRDELKHNGFRWSPREGSWQRFRSNYAIYIAKQIANKLQEAHK